MAGRVVPEPEAKALLREAGVPVPSGAAAGFLEEVLAVAESIGYPVVLKAVCQGILHKTEAGAVALGIPGPDALVAAYQEMTSRLAGRPEAGAISFLVERMMPTGTEVIVGVRRDPQFGPSIVVGLGGVFVEYFGDVACRVAPLERSDAREMWQELRAAPLLTGARGSPRLDTDALEELLLAVSRFALGSQELRELDLNPVLLYPRGAVAVDVLMIVDHTEARP